MNNALTKRRFIMAFVMMGSILLGMLPFTAHAVTADEMEQARATTALWYLRYVNDGSDYLEKLSPKSVSELEKSLKTKEKENIKAFKAVKVPSDYASWDKDKLVEYWSVSFFKSQGLAEKGILARHKVKKLVGAMNVAAPAPAQPAEAAPAEAAAAAPAESPLDHPELQTAEEIVTAAQAQDSAASALPVVEESAAAADEAARNKQSAGSMTWVYVIALLLLIGVVVWLVIFASKTMQNQQQEQDQPSPIPAASAEEEPQPVRRRRSLFGGKSRGIAQDEEMTPAQADTQLRAPAGESVADRVTPAESIADRFAAAAEEGTDSMRDKYARSLASKDEEIRMLHREIHDLREECLKLGEENGRLTSDLSQANRELDALRGRLRAASALTSAASAAPAAPAAPTRRAATADPSAAAQTRRQAESAGEPREIYLGRVNAKGIFVRADRKPVAEKSVYVLMTQDGFTGSFRVLQQPDVIDMALDNPEYYLAGGCVAQDITDTEHAEAIRTLSAGTAVFEDGCWRVLRKSKIAYE